MSETSEIPVTIRPTPADVTLRGNSRSSSIGALAGALAKAQGAVKNPLRERKVKIKTKSGHEYSFFYADLAACLEVARPVLSANGLAIVQSCSVQGRDAVVVTELMHTSGEWIRSELGFRASEDIKELAGVFTYLRRYAISPIIGIAPEDDDQVEQSQTQPEPAKKAAQGDYKHINTSEGKPVGNGSKNSTSATVEPEKTSAAAKAEVAPSAAPAEPSTDNEQAERKAMLDKAMQAFPKSKQLMSSEAKDLLFGMCQEIWGEDDPKPGLNATLKNHKLPEANWKNMTVDEGRKIHSIVAELAGVDGSKAPF